MQAVENLALRQNAINIEPGLRKLDTFIFESAEYTLKIVENEAEYKSAIQLRKDVFYNEYGATELFKSQFQDIWDSNADILIIISKETKEVIGTYRIICSEKTSSFYTQSEFFLDKLLELPGTKIELSRACIKKEFRNGRTLNMLWKGIAEYSKRVNAKYLFGCSSIWTTKIDDILEAFRYLNSKGYISKDISIETVKKYAVPDFEKLLDERKDNPIPDILSNIISPLLLTYLKANAKLYGTPAIDEDFSCTDFFTILDMDNINERFKRKYLK